MENSVAVINKLKAKQEELKISDCAFATKLGISRQMWAFIKSGKRKPGQKVLNAVMSTFPELWLEIANFMASEGQGKKAAKDSANG